jgi:hypothetical protein
LAFTVLFSSTTAPAEYTPPPDGAVFCDTMHPVSCRLPDATYTPPPALVAVLPVITQFTSTGLLDDTYTPPPWFDDPPRSVKPSRRAPAPF